VPSPLQSRALSPVGSTKRSSAIVALRSISSPVTELLLMNEEAAVWTGKDDEKIGYGKWNDYLPQPKDSRSRSSSSFSKLRAISSSFR
jgi:hypothetical protein